VTGPVALRTPICDLFRVDVPIVQTGMGWVAGPRLVSATAEAGALGILASATMTYDQLASAIREVKARTDRPTPTTPPNGSSSWCASTCGSRRSRSRPTNVRSRH
jgi:NAD(P)H-dependent flavin oxidoreductase YrpB (nitropropane dioxygenase family)